MKSKLFFTSIFNIIVLFANAQNLSSQQLIGKWEALNISASAKKSAALNQVLNLPFMQKSLGDGVSEFSFNFIDEKSVISLNSKNLDSTAFIRYEINNQNKSNSIIKLHYPKKENEYENENLPREEEYEVLFHNSDSLIIRIKLKPEESLPLLKLLQMYIPSNEKIADDEELFMTITLKRIIEVPWQKKLNISDKNEQIVISANDKNVILWYHKMEETNPNYKFILFYSIDGGIGWQNIEFRLDSAYEYVSSVVPVKSGAFFISSRSDMYFWLYTDAEPKKLSSANYSEEFRNGISNINKMISKNDTIIMMLNSSIWFSVNGGKNWDEIEEARLDSTSYFKTISLNNKAELLMETIHNDAEGKSKNLLSISFDCGKNNTPITLPVEEEKQSTGNETSIGGMFSALANAFSGGKVNSFLDNEGNIYVNHGGKIMMTSDNGKKWNEVALPECNQQPQNIMNMMFGNASPTNIKFSNTYEACSSQCGLWYKKIKSNNWKLARFTELDNVSDENFVIVDDVLIALGKENQVYTLNLTDN